MPFYREILQKIMKLTLNKIAVLVIFSFFSIIFIVSFVIYPDVGEKILYGKHPPGKESRNLEYSEIILSGNYDCIESASIKASGDLPKFVKEFNNCNK